MGTEMLCNINELSHLPTERRNYWFYAGFSDYCACYTFLSVLHNDYLCSIDGTGQNSPSLHDRVNPLMDKTDHYIFPIPSSQSLAKRVTGKAKSIMTFYTYIVVIFTILGYLICI